MACKCRNSVAWQTLTVQPAEDPIDLPHAALARHAHLQRHLHARSGVQPICAESLLRSLLVCILMRLHVVSNAF